MGSVQNCRYGVDCCNVYATVGRRVLQGEAWQQPHGSIGDQYSGNPILLHPPRMTWHDMAKKKTPLEHLMLRCAVVAQTCTTVLGIAPPIPCPLYAQQLGKLRYWCIGRPCPATPPNLPWLKKVHERLRKKIQHQCIVPRILRIHQYIPSTTNVGQAHYFSTHPPTSLFAGRENRVGSDRWLSRSTVYIRPLSRLPSIIALL
ncbi:hypothetical protein BCV70DRAFT_84899 [Testicularia cyperi]|uniref:Uncharacterized protein n=1 Tax=Testicularia cyperi TaxID=1882483 RepID=A0A317XSQ3_9BASI|nr:hypothetical protein BCV70DRAFT_84899 [Testicularia cyperi]